MGIHMMGKKYAKYVVKYFLRNMFPNNLHCILFNKGHMHASEIQVRCTNT